MRRTVIKNIAEKEHIHVNKELEGLKVEINSLGEINANFDIDIINSFLDKHVPDKKLVSRNKNDN